MASSRSITATWSCWIWPNSDRLHWALFPALDHAARQALARRLPAGAAGAQPLSWFAPVGGDTGSVGRQRIVCAGCAARFVAGRAAHTGSAPGRLVPHPSDCRVDHPDAGLYPLARQHRHTHHERAAGIAVVATSSLALVADLGGDGTGGHAVQLWLETSLSTTTPPVRHPLAGVAQL